MSDELTDKEKAFIVETIRLIFRAGLVKGELEGHAVAVAMAQSIIEKLEQPVRGNGAPQSGKNLYRVSDELPP